MMAKKRMRYSLIFTAVALALTVLASAAPARVIVRPRPVVVAPVRVAPVVGFRHGIHAGQVVAVPVGNYGRVDFNVKPKSSKIFVDGALIGIADEWDGGFFGTTATLKAGTHDVRIVAPDGQVVNRKIHVMPGKELNLNITF